MSRVTRLRTRLLHSMLMLGAGGALAQATPPPPEANPPPARGYRSSLPESVRRVERQTGGEVLRAEPMQRDGREVYRLKVLTADGRVRVVQDDPEAPPAKRRPASRSAKEKQTSRDSDEIPQQ